MKSGFKPARPDGSVVGPNTVSKTVAGIFALSLCSWGAWQSFHFQSQSQSPAIQEAPANPKSPEVTASETAPELPVMAPSVATSQSAPTAPPAAIARNLSASTQPSSPTPQAIPYLYQNGPTRWTPSTLGVSHYRRSPSLKAFRSSVRAKKTLKKSKYASSSQMRRARSQSQRSFSQAASQLLGPSGSPAPMAPRDQVVLLLTLAASQGPGYEAAPIFTQLLQNSSLESSENGLNVCQLSALSHALTPGDAPEAPQFDALFQQNCSEARSPLDPLASLSTSSDCSDPLLEDALLCAEGDSYTQALAAAFKALSDDSDANDPE